MPKIYVPKTEKPPKEGDLFVVRKVTASTDDLLRPAWDVYLERVSDEKQKQNKKP